MTEEGIYAARDRYGRFPLVIGREKNGGYAAATESSSSPTWGMKRCSSLEPGEIVRLDRTGIHDEQPAGSEKQVCAFLWIYTGISGLGLRGDSVENARERCVAGNGPGGHVEADFVTGVPDSGVGHAIGYAMESGLPFGGLWSSIRRVTGEATRPRPRISGTSWRP